MSNFHYRTEEKVFSTSNDKHYEKSIHASVENGRERMSDVRQLLPLCNLHAV